jgi:hypothetical protein
MGNSVPLSDNCGAILLKNTFGNVLGLGSPACMSTKIGLAGEERFVIVLEDDVFLGLGVLCERGLEPMPTRVGACRGVCPSVAPSPSVRGTGIGESPKYLIARRVFAAGMAVLFAVPDIVRVTCDTELGVG